MRYASSSAAISSLRKCAARRMERSGSSSSSRRSITQYAVDFDGNGQRDMIRSAPDALASAANYLEGIGWQPGQPWIEEVRVPADMDWSQADVTIKKPRAYWAQARRHLPERQGAARRQHADRLCCLPMGRNGPAFLTYPNFDVYLEWNQSLVYSHHGGPITRRGSPARRALSRGRGDRARCRWRRRSCCSSFSPSAAMTSARSTA